MRPCGFDPDEYRAAARETWDRAAPGWAAQRERFQTAALAVSRWMVDALALQPGHDVLEIAAGPGDTGFLAAELIRPGGRLLCSDGSEGMVQVARDHAAELGIENVQFRVLDAEWLDISAAQLDAVLCRWGFMLLVDPPAAIREARRVLRPGGRIALAAWDRPERNPWLARRDAVVIEQGLTPEPAAGAPGPFAWSDPATIANTLAEAGFMDIEVAAIDLTFTAASFDAWWAGTLDQAPRMAALVAELNDRQIAALRDGLAAALAEFTAADGRIELPARTHVAAASA